MKKQLVPAIKKKEARGNVQGYVSKKLKDVVYAVSDKRKDKINEILEFGLVSYLIKYSPDDAKEFTEYLEE